MNSQAQCPDRRRTRWATRGALIVLPLVSCFSTKTVVVDGGGSGTGGRDGGVSQSGGNVGTDGGGGSTAGGGAPGTGGDTGSGGAASGTGGTGTGTGGSATGTGGRGTGGTGTGGTIVGTGGRGSGGTGTGGADTGGSGTGGRVGTGGAGTGGSGTGGAVPAACDVTRPFGTPVLVAGLNGASGPDDGTARLSADELTAYFYSDRAPGYRIYSATRVSRTDPFSTLQVIGGIDAGAGGVLKFPTVTADALTIYFESEPGGVFKVMVATRTTVAAQFSASAPVAGINAGPNDSEPFVLPDGSALYFMSTRNNANGTSDLYRAARGTSGQFTTPTKVSIVNTPSTGVAPVVTPDELVLYFATDRSDAAARGLWDIWMTKRTSASAAFEPPVIVQELNTGGNEIPDWISPDRCRIYFDRLGSNGIGDKIYVAERAP